MQKFIEERHNVKILKESMRKKFIELNIPGRVADQVHIKEIKKNKKNLKKILK